MWFAILIACLPFCEFGATCNVSNFVSWRSVLLEEETGVHGENYRPAANHRHISLHNVVSSTTRHEWDLSLQHKTTCITKDVLQMLMGINTRKVSDGRIQPAFFASLVKDPYTLTGINDVVKFEDVRVNRGQGYNPSTGVFTAPRKGIYHISCMIFGYRGHVVHYQINKNDALYTYGYSRKGVDTTSTLSVIVEMKKGDRVFIKHRATSSSEQINGSHYSTFSGYFLQE